MPMRSKLECKPYEGFHAIQGWHTHTNVRDGKLRTVWASHLFHGEKELLYCDLKKIIAGAFLVLVLVYDTMDMALLIKHVHRDVAVNKNENGTLTLGILGYCLDLYNIEESCTKSLGQLLSNHPIS